MRSKVNGGFHIIQLSFSLAEMIMYTNTRIYMHHPPCRWTIKKSCMHFEVFVMDLFLELLHLKLLATLEISSRVRNWCIIWQKLGKPSQSVFIFSLTLHQTLVLMLLHYIWILIHYVHRCQMKKIGFCFSCTSASYLSSPSIANWIFKQIRLIELYC